MKRIDPFQAESLILGIPRIIISLKTNYGPHSIIFSSTTDI